MNYRIYYNREQDFPQVWSVDEGDQASEINVVGWDVEGCRVSSGEYLVVTVEERMRRPRVWMWVHDASMRIVGGKALFSRQA